MIAVYRYTTHGNPRYCHITGSPAGRNRANVDDSNSAIMVNFNHLQKPHLWINWFELNLARVTTSRVSTTMPSLVKIVSAVAWWWNIRVACLLLLNFVFVFIFLDTHTAYTREPIWTRNSSKDADVLEKVPFKQVFFYIFTLWGSFSPKTPNIPLPVGKSHAQWNVE